MLFYILNSWYLSYNFEYNTGGIILHKPIWLQSLGNLGRFLPSDLPKDFNIQMVIVFPMMQMDYEAFPKLTCLGSPFFWCTSTPHHTSVLWSALYQ